MVKMARSDRWSRWRAATPVREMELGGSCRPAVVGLEADPRLERPVAAVWGLAGLEQPGEWRSVIFKADAIAALAVADLELDLGDTPTRRAGVDRVRGSQHLRPPAYAI